MLLQPGHPTWVSCPKQRVENNLAPDRQLTKAGERAAHSQRTHARSVGRVVPACALGGDRCSDVLRGVGLGSPEPLSPWLRSHRAAELRE